MLVTTTNAYGYWRHNDGNVRVLPPRAFEDMVNVGITKTIMLDSNKINETFCNTFPGENTRILEYLYLRSNKLKIFPNTSALTKLTFLYLSNNMITYVPASHIAPSVKSMYMVNNPITCLSSAFYIVIPWGYNFDMGDVTEPRINIFPCQFTNIYNSLKVYGYQNDVIGPCDPFQSYSMLKRFRVSNGNLVLFPTLKSATRLTHLELVDNKINQLPNKTNIPKQNKLETIDVSHNEIDTVPSHFFMNMNKLKDFKIVGNNIKILLDPTLYTNFGKQNQFLQLFYCNFY